MSELRGAILVLAATPGRAQELTRALESTKPGSAILSSSPSTRWSSAPSRMPG